MRSAGPRQAGTAHDGPGEQGLKGLNFTSWNALYAPAATPKPVIQRLSAELLKILANPEVRKRIENTGCVVRPGSSEALGRLTMEEHDNYKKMAADVSSVDAVRLRRRLEPRSSASPLSGDYWPQQ